MQSILGNSRKHDVTFARNGKITISSRVSKLLDIQPGDCIDILADKKGEYYLTVAIRKQFAVGRHEAVCYRANKGAHHWFMCAGSVRLCRHILGLNKTESVAHIPAGDLVELSDGMLAVPLIVKWNIT